VRFGINLGPVRVVNDINGQPNIIGDGINVAQRIMSFAQPNQILVSRSYYDMTSRLTQEISQMFDYSGIKHDKHVREHEVYSVRLLKNQTVNEELSPKLENNSQPNRWLELVNKVNWKYAALVLPSVVAILFLIKMASTFTEPATQAENPSATQAAVHASAKLAEAKTKKSKSNDKLGWGTFKDSVKQGTGSKCTQAEISMNQCRQ
jgi:hypothetical protein